jgi:hypothetical protein
MFESVNQKILIQPYCDIGQFFFPISLKGRDDLATDDHADIRGLGTA